MLALNSYQTLAVGILLYYLGKLLKKNIRFLQTYCIPNPVIGGVLFALLNLALFESELEPSSWIRSSRAFS